MFPRPTLRLAHTVLCPCGAPDHEEQVRVHLWAWPHNASDTHITVAVSEYMFRHSQPYATAWWRPGPLEFLIMGMQ